MKDSVYKISLDINEHGSQVVLKAKQSDTGRKIHISLRAGGTPYTIDEDCYAVFTATKPDGSILYNECTIEGNEIIYEFTAQTCAAIGRSRCEIKLYGKDDTLITSPRFALLIDGIVYPDGRVESTDEFSALVQMVSDTLTVQASASEAAESANEATGNAIEVTEKAKVATAAANQATTAATKAAQSASTATDSANGSAVRASEAAEAANNATTEANTAAENANEAATNVVRIVKNAMAVGEASGVIASLEDAVELGFVGCRIFGKTTQDGTPTPENPVELVSAGDNGSINVSVAEKNLWNGKFENIAFGSSEETGAIVTILSYPKYKSIVVPVIPGGKYSFSRGNAIWSGLYIAFTQDYPTLHTKLIFEDGNTTTYLSPYNKGTALEIPGITVPDDCYYMVVYLTNDSDTYDVTNTWYQVEAGETVTGREPHNGQTITISTPNGLPGIPVTSGGNYTDANGQQWICDEIDLARGVYVQRILKEVWTNGGIYNGAEGYVSVSTKSAIMRTFAMSNIAVYVSGFKYGTFWKGGENDPRYIIGLKDPTTGSVVFSSLEEFWSAVGKVEIQAILKEPIETPLSEEELAAYAALHTYRDNTTVTNDAGAWMELEYVMDAKKYIDSLVGSGGSSRLTNVTLKSSAWKTESDGLHSQVVSIAGVTEYSKVDLLPSVEQLAIFHNKDVTFVTENEDGVVTVYAIGDKPILDYTMQAQITEVVV